MRLRIIELLTNRRAKMIDYDATEAEYLDDGGDYVVDIEYERRQEILNDRRRRERNLIGRYLVVTDSRYQSGLGLYLQDGRYGDGYWTKFLSNAKGFDKSAAIIKANNLRHGNPRVMRVQSDGTLMEVYNNGRTAR